MNAHETLEAGRRQSHHKAVQQSKVVVHLLRDGRMACGLDQRPPKEWPKGQLWVGLDKSHLVSCDGCMREASAARTRRDGR